MNEDWTRFPCWFTADIIQIAVINIKYFLAVV